MQVSEQERIWERARQHGMYTGHNIREQYRHAKKDNNDKAQTTSHCQRRQRQQYSWQLPENYDRENANEGVQGQNIGNGSAPQTCLGCGVQQGSQKHPIQQKGLAITRKMKGSVRKTTGQKSAILRAPDMSGMRGT